MPHITKLSLLILGIAACPLASAQTYTADFSTDNGGFSALNQTNLNNTSNELSFVAQNGQGGGASIDVLGSLGLNNSSNSLTANPLYFNFSIRVPDANNSTNHEAGFYFGRDSNQATTGSITSGSDINAFTLFVDDGNLYGQNGRSSELILSNVASSEVIDIQVEWQAVAGQNQGQYNNVAIVNAQTESGTQSATTTLQGAQNQNGSDINRYTFNGVAPRDNTGTITAFTASTSPIVSAPPVNSVPEPSSSVLLLGSCSILLLRRNRK